MPVVLRVGVVLAIVVGVVLATVVVVAIVVVVAMDKNHAGLVDDDNSNCDYNNYQVECLVRN